jgi:hypothetical protein
MKLKAKGNSETIIEKFSAQSSKSAKFAKTMIKKKEDQNLNPDKKPDGTTEGGTNANGTQGANNNAS